MKKLYIRNDRIELLETLSNGDVVVCAEGNASDTRRIPKDVFKRDFLEITTEPKERLQDKLTLPFAIMLGVPILLLIALVTYDIVVP